MRKNSLKVLSVVLCLSIMCGSASFEVVAYARSETEKSVIYPGLKGIDPDTIVAYYHGIPVRAYNIDENGSIDIGSLVQPFALEPYSDLTISKTDRGKAIYVQGYLATVGFGQRERSVFLPNKCIADMYTHLLVDNSENLMYLILGIIPEVGKVVGLAATLTAYLRGFMSNDLVERLDEIRRNGGDACLSIIDTPYGTFRTVQNWNGWIIPGSNCTVISGSVTTTYTVESIIYGCEL